MEAILRKYKVMMFLIFLMLIVACIVMLMLKLGVKKEPKHGVYVMQLTEISKEWRI